MPTSVLLVHHHVTVISGHPGSLKLNVVDIDRLQNRLTKGLKCQRKKQETVRQQQRRIHKTAWEQEATRDCKSNVNVQKEKVHETARNNTRCKRKSLNSDKWSPQHNKNQFSNMFKIFRISNRNSKRVDHAEIWSQPSH